ncbi:hypothetical protein U1Q18_019779 [Sarracenia purpurea var. burkii]
MAALQRICPSKPAIHGGERFFVLGEPPIELEGETSEHGGVSIEPGRVGPDLSRASTIHGGRGCQLGRTWGNKDQGGPLWISPNFYIIMVAAVWYFDMVLCVGVLHELLGLLSWIQLLHAVLQSTIPQLMTLWVLANQFMVAISNILFGYTVQVHFHITMVHAVWYIDMGTTPGLLDMLSDWL